MSELVTAIGEVGIDTVVQFRRPIMVVYNSYNTLPFKQIPYTDISEHGKIKVPASALVIRTRKLGHDGYLKYLSQVMRVGSFTGKESVVIAPDWEIKEFNHFWARVEEEALGLHKDLVAIVQRTYAKNEPKIKYERILTRYNL